MNQSWLDQLEILGASPAALTSTTAKVPTNAIQFIDRSDLVVVSITGSDAGTFLQSQMCNDQALVTAELAQISGYCSPKGRLLALPTVISNASGDGFYWLLPKSVSESVIKRLTMFVLRSDVSIKIVSEFAVVGLTLGNDRVPAALEPWLGKPDAAPMSSWEASGHFAVKARSKAGVHRALLFGTTSELVSSLSSCAEAAQSELDDSEWLGHASWVLGDIQAGVPTIVELTQDAFIPQMVNLEQVDGLSFTKGCYPGQEIVARMQYLGKLKRTMVAFTSDALNVANPGDKLQADTDENAGEVVSSVAVDDGMACLAVVKKSADLNTFQYNGDALKPQVLPYA